VRSELEREAAQRDNSCPNVSTTLILITQDVWLETVMRRNGWDTRPGFYLDLGAFHPTRCSNTALLDIHYGWKGVCVEPRSEIDFSSRSCALVNRPMTGTSGVKVQMGGSRDGQIFNIGRRGEQCCVPCLLYTFRSTHTACWRACQSNTFAVANPTASYRCQQRIHRSSCKALCTIWLGTAALERTSPQTRFANPRDNQPTQRLTVSVNTCPPWHTTTHPTTR
jgi:hypothetical protein